MNNKVKPIVIASLIFVSFTAFAEDKQFNEKEIEALKTVAGLWAKGEIVTSWINVVWIPIAAIIGALLGAAGMWFYIRTRVETWFINDLAKKLKMSEDSLSLGINKVIKDLEIKKEKSILIVDEKGNSAGLKTFLENVEYKKIQPPISMIELEKINKASVDLIIFNFLNKDLGSEQNKFGNELMSCKGKTRTLVLGKGRLDDKYSIELEHFLSISNGVDTLDDRIIQSLKQPLPVS